MAATRQDIDRWIKTAKENNDKYILSVCDTYEYSDYPVYFKTIDELLEKYNDYDFIDMQKVNEIIRINIDGTVTENLKLHNL
ncbi:MAG: hypothetical protein ACOC2W_02930 [bacterium]